MQYTIEDFYKAKCINKLRKEYGEEIEIERVPFGDSSILKVQFEYGIDGYIEDDSRIITLFYFCKELVAVQTSGNTICQYLYYRDTTFTKNYELLVKIIGLAEDRVIVANEKNFKKKLIEELPRHIWDVTI